MTTIEDLEDRARAAAKIGDQQALSRALLALERVVPLGGKNDRFVALCNELEQTPLVAVPMIHLNGTSRNELQRQLQEAVHAVNLAAKALREAQPNKRDYYPQGEDAWKRAVAQHQDRLDRIRSVSEELMHIFEAIDE